LYVLLKIAAS